MHVKTHERTLIDKLFAMCHYYLENKTERYSRHIYDVHMIWTKSNVDVERIKALVPNIIKDRQANSDRNISSKSGSRPQDLLRVILKTDFIKKIFYQLQKN